MTRSHLRFSPHPIKSSYFVKHPEFVVCSKESYIDRYDMLTNMKEKGTFLYVTSKNVDELKQIIPNEFKKILYDRKIKFYTIDAYELANMHGLQNKISMILETCILKISDFIDFDIAMDNIKKMIITNFSKKGDKIVNANIESVKDTMNYLHKVEVDVSWIDKNSVTCKVAPPFPNKIYEKMLDLSANDLKVSDFLPYKDGTYEVATSQYEKRDIAENIPIWIPVNCIQCNQCSFVCPHAVVRPFLLNEEEYNKAPDNIKDKCIDAIGLSYKLFINISLQDCTGCGVCARTCPGKNGAKALDMQPVISTCDATTEYLMKNVTEKKDAIKPYVKFSQFKKPRFEYSGACAGCGETPYLKLLSQLFGDRLVIANATGCSSIYGASTPSMPWSVAWANSLFEDNAEFGYGILTGVNTMRHRIKNLIEQNIASSDDETKTLLNEWLSNYDNYDITKKVYDQLDYKKVPYLEDVREYIPSRSVWTIGGDGWAYDIGFGGIDHVLSSNDNINILVLDTQVYSNTGGQMSKASERGSIAKFAFSGKKTAKKDLARIAMSYPNVYVASICMGANMQQTLNAMMEAERHDGPSIIIAYSPCINQGIKAGMGSMIDEEKKAVECGYVPIFRYNPETEKFTLDYREPNFDLYGSFIEGENRFAMLKALNEDKANELLNELKGDSMKRFAYYKSLAKDEKINI
jgi:pyruvate-ferredoxin/flavodoxin oxidoreductase